MLGLLHVNNIFIENLINGINSVKFILLFRVDFTKYPGLRDVTYYNVTMEAGDCLFIPYKW